jgi:hypothetical protein
MLLCFGQVIICPQITQIKEKKDRIIAGVSRAEMQQKEFGI